MPEICLCYLWYMPDIFMRYVLDICVIYLRYAQDLYDLSLKISWDIPDICLDISEIYLRHAYITWYAWYIPETFELYLIYIWYMSVSDMTNIFLRERDVWDMAEIFQEYVWDMP